ncbi:unnamed protein product, partial [Prorocentrum cordatum]
MPGVEARGSRPEGRAPRFEGRRPRIEYPGSTAEDREPSAAQPRSLHPPPPAAGDPREAVLGRDLQVRHVVLQAAHGALQLEHEALRQRAAELERREREMEKTWQAAAWS